MSGLWQKVQADIKREVPDAHRSLCESGVYELSKSSKGIRIIYLLPGNMKTEYQYIRFEEMPNPGKKTRYFRVVNIRHVEVIGWIEWSGAWWQYVFATHGEIILSVGCMADIQDFIAQLRAERKAKKKEVKTDD